MARKNPDTFLFGMMTGAALLAVIQWLRNRQAPTMNPSRRHWFSAIDHDVAMRTAHTMAASRPGPQASPQSAVGHAFARYASQGVGGGTTREY